ncbi:unnamed protein product [Diplocarpon coronariae]|uniref:Uncharacterized protein n=1 Tax=Diplocarpon coronariae TaxID=2795749 RepID=A0A218YXB7_9HELO|nr:hypothetical protein B2J93_3885 [Marssonina coronariae]
MTPPAIRSVLPSVVFEMAVFLPKLSSRLSITHTSSIRIFATGVVAALIPPHWVSKLVQSVSQSSKRLSSLDGLLQLVQAVHFFVGPIPIALVRQVLGIYLLISRSRALAANSAADYVCRVPCPDANEMSIVSLFHGLGLLPQADGKAFRKSAEVPLESIPVYGDKSVGTQRLKTLSYHREVVQPISRLHRESLQRTTWKSH